MRCFGSTILGKIKSEKGKRENKTDGHWTLRDGSCGEIDINIKLRTRKSWKKSTLLLIYTWLAVAPEDSRAENPVTTVTVFSRFTVFHVKNTWAGDGGLEKLHRLFFFGLGGTWLRSPWSLNQGPDSAFWWGIFGSPVVCFWPGPKSKKKTRCALVFPLLPCALTGTALDFSPKF